MARAYAPVDGVKLSSILAGLPDLRARLGGKPAEWRVREVGDGNLNLVFIVEGPAGGLVVKQALPYVRLVGESPGRCRSSGRGSNTTRSSRRARYAPRLTPQVFHFDREQAHDRDGVPYAAYHHAQRFGPRHRVPALRRRHRRISRCDAVLTPRMLGRPAAEQKRRLALFARNIELCRITEDLVFTDPYREAPLNRWTSPQLDADKRAVRDRRAAQGARRRRCKLPVPRPTARRSSMATCTPARSW